MFIYNFWVNILCIARLSLASLFFRHLCVLLFNDSIQSLTETNSVSVHQWTFDYLLDSDTLRLWGKADLWPAACVCRSTVPHGERVLPKYDFCHWFQSVSLSFVYALCLRNGGVLGSDRHRDFHVTNASWILGCHCQSKTSVMVQN